MFLTHFAGFQMHKNLKHLIVHVTNHCNFRCKHCFIDFSPKRDLPLETYQALGQELGKLFWLDIGGGEPFLRKDIVDICASFQAEVMTIPTNGFLVDRTVEMTRGVRDRIKGELTIALSIDGLEPTHDRIREKGSWEKLWTTFEALKKIEGVRVKINTVLCKENFDEILPLMELVYARRPDFHSIILLRGNPIDPSFGLPPISELKKIQEPLFSILGRYDYGHGSFTSRVLRNYHRYLWNLSLQTIEQRRQIIPCLAGKAHAVVMGNGDVSSCEMLPPIGNIKDSSWTEIWQGEALKAQRESIRRKECYCTHNCAMLDSILYRPASYPQLIGGVELGR
jgi:MoaA/NifB/PqqE/SkfB family radical SAM enzyme